MAPSVQATANRVRAALAYANIQVKASPERVGITTATMARIVSPTEPRGASPDEIDRIVDATGVPRWFFEHGFAPPAEVANETLYERVGELERRYAALTHSAGERPQGPAGELGRVAEGSPTNGSDRQDTDSDQAADARRGNDG